MNFLKTIALIIIIANNIAIAQQAPYSTQHDNSPSLSKNYSKIPENKDDYAKKYLSAVQFVNKYCNFYHPYTPNEQHNFLFSVVGYEFRIIDKVYEQAKTTSNSTNLLYTDEYKVRMDKISDFFVQKITDEKGIITYNLIILTKAEMIDYKKNYREINHNEYKIQRINIPFSEDANNQNIPARVKDAFTFIVEYLVGSLDKDEF
jgi:hypothetical protein